MKHIEVVPSYPSDTFEHLETVLQSLMNVSYGFQIDIVDGLFVECAPSWPFSSNNSSVEDELAKLTPFISQFEFEIDCMVNDPIQYFDTFSSLGIKKVVLHFGSSLNLENDIKIATEKYSFDVSLGVLNETEFVEYKDLLSFVSGVQVMGIAHIGVQGQPFDTKTTKTIKKILEVFPRLKIAVDGSVNKSTIPALVAAGATRLAPGSAIVKQANPADAYKELLLMANSQQG